MLAAADIKEGGSVVANILGIDGIKIDNQLDGDVFLVGGGGSRGAINPGSYQISGTLKAMFEDAVAATTYYYKARNFTESSIDFTLKRGSGDGTDTNESLQTVLTELNYEPASPVIQSGKGAILSLNFKGFFDNSADGTAMKMVIKNSAAPWAMM